MLRLVSFDAMRTLDVHGCYPVRPEDWFREKARVQAADWVLFPEYWQVNPMVYAWRKRIFPSANSYHLGHDKVEMTRAFLADSPANVPATLILAVDHGAEEKVLDAFDFPFVAKIVRSSMGMGVFLIEDRAALRSYLASQEVAYIQEYLPIDRDLRIVVIGREAVLAYWRQGRPGQFHHNVARGAEISFDDVPPHAVTMVVELAQRLGIDHAGFDVAMVDNHPYLLEFNVRFGCRALATRGVRIGPLIERYLGSLMTPPVAPRSSPLPKAS